MSREAGAGLALAVLGLLAVLVLEPPVNPVLAGLAGLALAVAGFAVAAALGAAQRLLGRRLQVAALSALLFHDVLAGAADALGPLPRGAVAGLTGIRLVLTLAAFVAVGRGLRAR